MDLESKTQRVQDGKPRRLDWKKSLQGQPREASLAFPCALQDHKSGRGARCSACQGEGFVLGIKGPHTAANVCSCVQKCAQCLGQGRRIEGGVSVSCRTPSVLQVVNLINGAQIPARYAEAALHRYQNFRERNGNGRKILAEVKTWLKEFQPGRSLVIEGPVGSGKTFILASLAKAFAIQGFSVKFADFFQLTSEIKAGFSEGKSDAALLQPLIDVDILVIDELGKGRNTDFELTVIDQLVCSRYNQRKTILASTNYKLKSSGPKPSSSYTDHPQPQGSSFNLDSFQSLEERIGQRIFSRLREMSVFLELNEDDFRSRSQPPSP